MKLTSYDLFRFDFHEYGIEYAARHARELGFEAVEFLENAEASSRPSLLELIEPKLAGKVLAENGLSVACYSAAVQLFADDAEEKVEKLLRNAELAAKLGSPYFHHTLVLRLPPSAPTYGEAFERILPYAEKIARRCNALGMTALYEPQGFYFNGIEGLGKIHNALKMRGCEVGICADLGNPLFVDVSPIDVTRAFLGEIRHVHLKNYFVFNDPQEELKCSCSKAGKYLSASELMDGVVDLGAAVTLLKGAGYSGALSIEWMGDDDAMRRTIEYVKGL